MSTAELDTDSNPLKLDTKSDRSCASVEVCVGVPVDASVEVNCSDVSGDVRWDSSAVKVSSTKEIVFNEAECRAKLLLSNDVICRAVSFEVSGVTRPELKTDSEALSPTSSSEDGT